MKGLEQATCSWSDAHLLESPSGSIVNITPDIFSVLRKGQTA
jgi:hypothetical protein